MMKWLASGMRRARVLLVVLGVALPIGAVAFTINPWEFSVVSYAGRLTNPSGAPVAFGTYSIVFRIWDSPTGGTKLFEKTHSVLVEDGYFSVLLSGDDGGTATMLSVVQAAPGRYLEMVVEGETLTPRQSIEAGAWSKVAFPTGP